MLDDAGDRHQQPGDAEADDHAHDDADVREELGGARSRAHGARSSAVHCRTGAASSPSVASCRLISEPLLKSSYCPEAYLVPDAASTDTKTSDLPSSGSTAKKFGSA